MAQDPAFLFYSSDFLTGTAFFSFEQKGKYISLLCLQHQHGRLTEKHMLSICSAHDEDVLSKFKKDAKGLFFNERLEEEIKKRKKFTDSRRKNAQNPKKQRVKKGKNGKAYAEHMENENEDENTNVLRVLEYKNIKVTNGEHQKLVEEHGESKVQQLYQFLSDYKTEKSYKTKSDYLTIRRWVVKAVNEKYETNKRSASSSKQTGSNQLLQSIADDFAARGGNGHSA